MLSLAALLAVLSVRGREVAAVTGKEIDMQLGAVLPSSCMLASLLGDTWHIQKQRRLFQGWTHEVQGAGDLGWVGRLVGGRGQPSWSAGMVTPVTQPPASNRPFPSSFRSHARIYPPCLDPVARDASVGTNYAWAWMLTLPSNICLTPAVRQHVPPEPTTEDWDLELVVDSAAQLRQAICTAQGAEVNELKPWECYSLGGNVIRTRIIVVTDISLGGARLPLMSGTLEIAGQCGPSLSDA